jgi:hypothetical protein
MSTRPRTPAEFPRMKHRAAGRLKRRADMEQIPVRFASMSTFIDAAYEGLSQMGRVFAQSMGLVGRHPRKSDYALAGEKK